MLGLRLRISWVEFVGYSAMFMDYFMPFFKVMIEFIVSFKIYLFLLSYFYILSIFIVSFLFSSFEDFS